MIKSPTVKKEASSSFPEDENKELPKWIVLSEGSVLYEYEAAARISMDFEPSQGSKFGSMPPLTLILSFVWRVSNVPGPDFLPWLGFK